MVVFLVTIVAGVFLGLFMKWLQFVTDIQVYTLLLNVDYVPFLGALPEAVEFMLHLLVAVVLGYTLFSVMQRKQLSIKHCIFLSISVNVAIAVFYFPITILSNETPAITSIAAFSLWLLAHLVYGFLLGLSLAVVRYQKSEKSD